MRNIPVFGGRGVHLAAMKGKEHQVYRLKKAFELGIN